jgi:uncharacterized membrane protein
MNLILYDTFLFYVRESIAAIGVAVIIIGALRSLCQLYLVCVHRTLDLNYIRLQFGNSVILGLEFMVGADIVGSLISPDYYNIGLLAIIVLIRTVLSYFLNLELQALSPQERKSIA